AIGRRVQAPRLVEIKREYLLHVQARVGTQFQRAGCGICGGVYDEGCRVETYVDTLRAILEIPLPVRIGVVVAIHEGEDLRASDVLARWIQSLQRIGLRGQGALTGLAERQPAGYGR